MFYSRGKSLFARVTACSGSHLDINYQLYQFRYLDLPYLGCKLTEIPRFSLEIVPTLKTFNQWPIFVKFHTIPPAKDKEISFLYPQISLIQVSYISERFKLNIEAIRKFKSFRSNESWINYRRTSGAFTVKCQGDQLYSSGLRSLHKGVNYFI